MTTFVGYDYLVTRKNKKNGGKMKMTGVGEFWEKSSHYLVPNGMSTHERRVKNRTWRKNFRALLVRLEVIYLCGKFD